MLTSLIKRPLSRCVTVLLDALPTSGTIKEHKFVTSFGAGMTFTQSDNHDSFAFKLHPIDGQVWSGPELRELAAECMQMADYLDARTTKQAQA